MAGGGAGGLLDRGVMGFMPAIAAPALGCGEKAVTKGREGRKESSEVKEGRKGVEGRK